MKIFQLKLLLCCCYIAAAFLIFGASLKYPFVYDDHAKIDQNPAIVNLQHVVKTFFDPANQSNDPALNHHMFRPLFVLSTAVEYSWFGGNVSGYRSINVLFHGINAFLAALIAESLFELSWGAMTLVGFAFLVHPTQVESVVWVVEQSNILSAFVIFLSMIFWVRYLISKKAIHVVIAGLAFFAGLLMKENTFVFPMAALLTAICLRRKEKIESVPVKLLVFFFSAVFLMFFVRTAILNQVGNVHSQPMGFQLPMICSAFFTSIRMLFVPWPITINHIYTPSWSWILGALVMSAALWRMKRNDDVLLCWALYVVFWFPTSNVIPIAAFFAERFLYVPLLAFALLQGLLWQAAGKRYGLPVRAVLIAVNTIFLILSLTVIPLWKNDVALWNNAAKITPGNWRAWYNLSESEKIVYGPAYPTDVAVLKRIKNDLIIALRCSLPSNYAAQVFLELAKTDFLIGEKQEAEENARRAAVLNSALMDTWVRYKTTMANK